ncbi:hypothetical protein CDEF62S_00954 [Castellaniella defragrans]
MTWALLWGLAFCSFNASIIWFDLRQRRVPNRLLLAGFGTQAFWLLANVFFALSLPISWRAVVMVRWPMALATAGVVLVVLFPLWRFHAMGAGDVKFAALLGFCMGPLGLLQAFIVGSLIAGLHAALYFVQREAPWLLGRLGRRSVTRSTPYAAYLALGVLLGMSWQLVDRQPWLLRLAGSA